ncbi:MAG: protein kinase domain-containing protein, partial [Acidobacteriota bacterium]
MKECSVCKYCFPDEVNHCPTDGNRLKPSIEGDTVLDGRYQLDRRLGHGGMGIVFQGRHIFLKTTFAVKVILPDLVGNDPMLVTRFRQEAMVAARMRHQNLVNVTDFGVVHGMPYLVMELIVGRSLHDILTSEGRLSPQRSLQIIEAVCAGVGAAHRQGVVHRDLKPLNIMLMNGVPVSEGIKVLDFGLAKIKSGELLGSFVAAQTTGLMGSPAYMAPELWSDDEPDARADVYSMGIILFQMLSGEVPFRGATIPSIMKKHLTQPPPSFAEQGVIVPREIEAVVRRALAKARDDRHPSVESFAEEFRDAVSTMDSAFDRTMPDMGAGMDVRTMPFPEASTEHTLAERQRRVEDEVEQLAREFEEAQLRADEARQRAEEATKRKAEEDTARKRAEEE